MQFSNGLTNPLGLWLGHLMFDTVWTVIISTLIVIVFAAAEPNTFTGLGFFVSTAEFDGTLLITENSGLCWCYMELLVLCSHTALRSWCHRLLLPLPLLRGIRSLCLS